MDIKLIVRKIYLPNANYYLKSNYIKIHLSTNFDRLWLLTSTTIKSNLAFK